MEKRVEVGKDKSTGTYFKNFHLKGTEGIWIYLERNMGLRERMFVGWDRLANIEIPLERVKTEESGSQLCLLLGTTWKLKKY